MTEREGENREDGPTPDPTRGSDPERPSGAAPRRAGRSDETIRTDALPESVRCPHCESTETEQFAAFGSALSVSQYYCRGCRTVFEFFKWR